MARAREGAHSWQMAVVDTLGADLPRTRGRASRELEVEFVRALGPADLALLASERGSTAPSIKRIRDRHHSLARCLATGMKNSEASLVTGYDPSRISILLRDPTFSALVEDYRRMENGAAADFAERAGVLTLTAVNQLQDALEDEESPLPVSTVLEIAKFGADRTGHAPVSKNIQVNVNTQLGDRLRAARQRLARLPVPADASIVDAEFAPSKEGDDGEP
jgi:hypothetical protein